MLWYFAYGSNMDPQRMCARIGRWVLRVPGVLQGWKLAFTKVAGRNPGEGYANIVPSPGGSVEGCLYRLAEAALDRLDRFEGAPTHYERRDVTVYRVNCGEAVKAVTYVARPERVKDGLTPAREYLEHLLAGADCLSEQCQRWLRAIGGLE